MQCIVCSLLVRDLYAVAFNMAGALEREEHDRIPRKLGALMSSIERFEGDANPLHAHVLVQNMLTASKLVVHALREAIDRLNTARAELSVALAAVQPHIDAHFAELDELRQDANAGEHRRDPMAPKATRCVKGVHVWANSVHVYGPGQFTGEERCMCGRVRACEFGLPNTDT